MPDMRGLFLRGYGSQAHSQNNGSLVGITSTTHSSGALKEVQGDATRKITGQGEGYRSAALKGALYDAGGYSRTMDSGSGAHRFGLDTSLVTPTAEENRPVNMAVRYLIRALP